MAAAKSECFTVGEGYLEWEEQSGNTKNYDYTRRPFTVALRAINFKTTEELVAYNIKPLSVQKISTPINNAKDIILDTTVIGVQWDCNFECNCNLFWANYFLLKSTHLPLPIVVVYYFVSLSSLFNWIRFTLE